MRILITSDLHFEVTGAQAIRRFLAGMDREEPDLVVLAGDIGHPPHLYRQCLALFLPLACPVAVIPGNQDVWTAPGSSSIALLEEELPAAVRELDFHWLEGHPLRLGGGVALCGSIGWYDYSAREVGDDDVARIAARKGEVCLDATRVDWEYTDESFAALCRDRLTSQVRELEGDPDIHTIVAVTHVPAFPQQYERQPEAERWCRTLPFFAHLTMGEELRRFPKLRYLVSGHTHAGLSDVVERPGMEPVATATVGSDYLKPRWVVLDL